MNHPTNALTVLGIEQGLRAAVPEAVFASPRVVRRIIRADVPSEETGTDGWRVASFLWQVRVPLNCTAARRLVDLFRALQALAVGLIVWGLLSAG